MDALAQSGPGARRSQGPEVRTQVGKHIVRKKLGRGERKGCAKVR